MMRTTLTIGRLGARGRIEPKTLRYYDRIGILRPAERTEAGYRLYDESALDRLEFIRRAKSLGMSLVDIRRVLRVRDEGAAPCAHVQEIVARNLGAVETQLQELKRLRADLRRLQRALRDRLPLDVRSAEVCPCFTIIRDFRKPAAIGPRLKAPRAG